MDQEKLSPELERFVSKVKLREPSPEMMANYLSEVNAKIDQGIKGSHFGFPQFAVVFAVGLAFAGSLYFFLVHPQRQPVRDVANISMQSVPENRWVKTTPSTPPQQVQRKVVVPANNKSLTVEEEMTVLEAFGDESSDESAELLEDEEAFEELTMLDDVELSPQMQIRTSNV